MVLTDSGALAEGSAEPALALDRASPALSVPAFDPAICNPMQWVRDAKAPPASLGPPELLPTPAAGPIRESAAECPRLRRSHHLEDIAAYHPDPVARAGMLVRIAATGLPVHLADGGPGLAPLLGAELHELMTNPTLRGADADQRERLSIRMRRLALRDHSLESRVQQICETAGLPDAPSPPPVSVLLATRRPAFLRWALANVTRQNYPRLELVLALHGEGFTTEGVESALSEIRVPIQLLRVGRERPLGSVLSAATDAAGGTLIAKMDDDDLYGPHHLWDLVLAKGYSAATLVGKRQETVYLCDAARTVRCFIGGAEQPCRWLAGGTLLIGRDDLRSVGGWRRLPRAVDLQLLNDTRRAGGVTFRTHGADYILIRHGDRHIWPEGDEHLRAHAVASHRGWQPWLAGIDVSLADYPELRNEPRPAASIAGGGT